MLTLGRQAIINAIGSLNEKAEKRILGGTPTINVQSSTREEIWQRNIYASL